MASRLKGYTDLMFTALLVILAVPMLFIHGGYVFMPINAVVLVLVFVLFYGFAVALSIKNRRERKSISRYSALLLPLVSLVASFEVVFVCDISAVCLMLIIWIIWIANLVLFFSALTKKAAKIVMGIIFGLIALIGMLGSVSAVLLSGYGVKTIDKSVSENGRYSAELKSIEVPGVGEASTIVYARSNENDVFVGIGTFGNKAQRIGRVGNKAEPEHSIEWNGDILAVDHLKYDVATLLSDDYDYGIEDVLSSITGAYIPLRLPDNYSSAYDNEGASCGISYFELSKTEKENILADAALYNGWQAVDENASEQIKGLEIADINAVTLSENDLYLIYDKIQMDIGFPDDSTGVRGYILLLYSAEENKLYVVETI